MIAVAGFDEAQGPLDHHEPACPPEAGCTLCTPTSVALAEAATPAPARKPYLSVSQINMLAKCGEQYRRRYVLGQKRPPAVAQVIGKGVHASVEKDLTSKLEWGELIDDEEIPDLAADATRRMWQADEPQREEGDPDQGGAVDEAVSLARLHHGKVAPAITPVALERAFLLEIPEFPFDLMGVVDVEEPTRIRDTKTSGKAPSGNPAERDLQGELYTLEARLRGHDKVFQMDHLVRGRSPRYIPSEARYTEADHLSFLRRVEAAAAAVKAGTFLPAAPGSWACSPKWCGYWNDCAWGARQQVTVGLIDPARLTSRLTERKS